MGVMDWIRDNGNLAWWIGSASVAMFVVGIFLVPFVVVRMPADYFLRPQPDPDSWRAHHPSLRLLVRLGKNLLGGVLVAAGILMLALPGQGILSILLGLSLLEFPGKRRLELWLVGRKSVLTAINWMRQRSSRDPLRLP